MDKELREKLARVVISRLDGEIEDKRLMSTEELNAVARLCELLLYRPMGCGYDEE